VSAAIPDGGRFKAKFWILTTPTTDLFWMHYSTARRWKRYSLAATHQSNPCGRESHRSIDIDRARRSPGRRPRIS
jgi:hypothetical protein